MIFVVQCVTDFAPHCMQIQHLSLPLMVQCFMVGTHSQCLREWENPIGNMTSFFHKVKIIYTNRGPKKDGEKEDFFFLMVKWAPSVGTRTIAGGLTEAVFLTIPLRWGESLLSIGTWERLRQRINGKATSRVTTCFISLRYGTLYGQVKKRYLCGSFGTKQW